MLSFLSGLRFQGQSLMTRNGIGFKDLVYVGEFYR